MDRPVPADPRCAAGRDDRPLPRAETAGTRLGTPHDGGLHRPPDREDRSVTLFAVTPMVRSLRPLNILVLVHPELVPPDSLKGYTDKEVHVFKTEYDVISTLKWRGHDVRPLGLKDELKPIRDAIDGWTPHVVFNLLEEFHGQATYDQNVASFLELLRLPYTGCNPRGLMLARGKALSKKLTSYHRVPTPAFTVIPIGRKIMRPARLAFPLIVKSATEDASLGIAQAS